MNSSIQWESPLLDEGFVGDLILVISPFVTRIALEKLLERVEPSAGFQLITRWDSDSLISGASDPEVYQLIKEKGWKLYLHDRIHLKLYITSQAQAVLSTGNLTLRGLGLARVSNIEASSIVELGDKDWVQINQILSECRAVTDEVYEVAITYVETNRKPSKPAPPLIFPSEPIDDSAFSYLSLPATKDIEHLWEFYNKETNPENIDPCDGHAKEYHDLHLYNISPGLPREGFLAQLDVNFKNHPFIKSFVNWLQLKETASFGQVKEWIQRNCSDKPTPYRRELTPCTQILYNWLAFHYKEISWNRPNHSQIIRWDPKRNHPAT